MKVISANIGQIRPLPHGTEVLPSAIFKTPCKGSVWVNHNGLLGDEQADRKLHGGPDKAVYAFPFEHYSFYGRLLGRNDFAHGQFGENLTIEGFTEDQVFIGDKFKIGSAFLEVSQPRIPCLKLGTHLGDTRVIQAMINSLRTGFYLRVLEEGEVKEGDIIEHFRVTGDGPCLTVSEVAAFRFARIGNSKGAGC